MTTTGLNRNTIDKYYTKTELAEYCIMKFNSIIKPKSKDYILEPSAGNGSFSNYLFNNYKNVIAIDIQPDNDNIKKQDFLEYSGSPCHVIGNPPFGRQSSLAKKFIKHSATFAG
jgi:predicted RNA methylase